MAITIKVDESKKNIVMKLGGNPTLEEMRKAMDELKEKAYKFKPKEASLMNISLSLVAVMSPDVMKVASEGQEIFPHFNKVATVTSSVLAETQYKRSLAQVGGSDNRRSFKTEEDAMAWLME